MDLFMKPPPICYILFDIETETESAFHICYHIFQDLQPARLNRWPISERHLPPGTEVRTKNTAQSACHPKHGKLEQIHSS